MVGTLRFCLVVCSLVLSAPTMGLGIGNQGQDPLLEPLSPTSTELPMAELAPVDLKESNSELELVQVFSYTRHGISIGYSLYNGEWLDYNMRSPAVGNPSEMTPLGLAQCWSVGYQLSLDFPEFVEASVEAESYLLNYIEMKKNMECTQYVWFGVQHYVPFLGFFDSQVVEEAMKVHGNCPNCSEEALFPYEMSQLETQQASENSAHSSERVDVHNEGFLDLDEDCSAWNQYMCTKTNPIFKNDLDLIQKISSNTLLNEDTIVKTLHKHLYHNIPLENGLEELSQSLIFSAQSMIDGATDCWLRSIMNAEESEWAIQALFARPLIDDLLRKLDSQEDAMNLYVVHDNNLVALLVYLFGVTGDIQYYIPYYASTVRLLIYQDAQTQEKYVKMEHDHESLTIRKCGEPCEFDTFVELLTEYSNLGQEPKEFCESTDEELVQSKEKKLLKE